MSLSAHLFPLLDESARAALAGHADALDAQWQEARRLHPDIELEADTFAAHLADKLSAGAAALETVRVDDLFVAAACARGNRSAIEHVEKAVFPALERALLRAGKSQADIDDALQILRERLFVGAPGRAPKIGDYKGLGRLGSWMRVAAIRILQNRDRAQHRELPVDSDRVWERLLPSGDPELEHMKARYRSRFRDALAAAVESLGDRERVLLRQHVVEGVPSHKLAALYKVHRATVSRWILAGQEALLAATRAQLMDELQVSSEELESVLRLIQSRFDIGLGEILAEGSGDGQRAPAPGKGPGPH